MKNTKIIPIIICIILLVGVLGFAAWKFTSKKAPVGSTALENDQTKKPIANDNEGSVKGTLLDLLKLGKTLKCTYSMTAENTTTSGTSYVAGTNMRGDFEIINPDGTKLLSHMISTGDWVYTWSSASPQGIKMKLTDTEAESPEPKGSNGEGSSATDAFKNSFDYKCSSWNEDKSMFQLPTDIQFIDLSESLKGVGTGDTKAMCAACNYAQSEEDKTACKKQLGCE